jgi:hypothetical protein
MNAFKRFITWISAGFLLAMLSGSPAYADDTELLLVPPPASDATKPRIMFIIDTSSSMTAGLCRRHKPVRRQGQLALSGLYVAAGRPGQLLGRAGPVPRWR